MAGVVKFSQKVECHLNEGGRDGELLLSRYTVAFVLCGVLWPSRWCVRSLFPNKGLNPGFGRENANHWTARGFPVYAVTVGDDEKFLEVGYGDSCTKM